MKEMSKHSLKGEITSCDLLYQKSNMEDQQVLTHIKNLSEKEEGLYAKGNLTTEEIKHLHAMQIELDQCWDFLRQRRALRDAGKNPQKAAVRPPDIITHYEE